MIISILFTDEELKLIWQALNLGAVHSENEILSGQMIEFSKKIELLAAVRHSTRDKG